MVCCVAPSAVPERPVVGLASGTRRGRARAVVGDVYADLLRPQLDPLLKTDLVTNSPMGVFNVVIDICLIGGFVMARLGRVPKTADHFEWGGMKFEVIDMDERRIDKVLVTRKPPASSQAAPLPGK